MTLSDWLPKTPVPLLVSRSFVSSMNPPPPLLLTVSTPSQKQNVTFSSSIWGEELLMFPSSTSPAEYLPSKLPRVTPTWVGRTSTTRFWNTSRRSSRGGPSWIFLMIPVLSDVSGAPANVQRGLCPVSLKQPLKSIHFTRSLVSFQKSTVPSLTFLNCLG